MFNLKITKKLKSHKVYGFVLEIRYKDWWPTSLRIELGKITYRIFKPIYPTNKL